MYKTIILKPRVMSEKAYRLSQSTRTYVFDVPGNVNKLSVARAVAAQYDVVVEDVNILNQKGKAKRTMRKGGRPIAGRDSDVKKAYVKLAEGNTLPIFADVEEAEAKEAEQAQKADKKESK